MSLKIKFNPHSHNELENPRLSPQRQALNYTAESRQMTPAGTQMGLAKNTQVLCFPLKLPVRKGPPLRVREWKEGERPGVSPLSPSEQGKRRILPASWSPAGWGSPHHSSEHFWLFLACELYLNDVTTLGYWVFLTMNMVSFCFLFVFKTYLGEVLKFSS